MILSVVRGSKKHRSTVAEIYSAFTIKIIDIGLKVIKKCTKMLTCDLKQIKSIQYMRFCLIDEKV